MKIFGRKGCSEDKRWTVTIQSIKHRYVVAEQLTKDDAKEIYGQLVESFEDKSLGIEVELPDNDDNDEMDVRYFSKRNIITISLWRDE